ncbi:hypothetical protein [uncultured Agrobacterium sp.]|uniref:hypothetical protein n=1 Tax=uncultured Agrobacterium sp. TaxID=157277 RepID=UPI0025E3D174|nr:hypothetical protein [uncultured Agrobacterium sp.]
MRALNLTDEVVRKLPYTTRGSIEIFGGPMIDGLKLVVSDSRKLFVHQPRLADRRVQLRVEVGFFPEISTQRAKTVARHIDVLVARAMEGQATTTKVAAVTPLTFEEVAEAYLETLPLRKHNKRAASDQRFFRTHLLDHDVNTIVAKQASDITKSDARRLITRLTRRHGRRVARAALSKLRAMFGWASGSDQGLLGIVGNPFSNLSPPRSRKRYVSNKRTVRPAGVHRS